MERFLSFCPDKAQLEKWAPATHRIRKTPNQEMPVVRRRSLAPLLPRSTVGRWGGKQKGKLVSRCEAGQLFRDPGSPGCLAIQFRYLMQD